MSDRSARACLTPHGLFLTKRIVMLPCKFREMSDYHPPPPFPPNPPLSSPAPPPVFVFFPAPPPPAPLCTFCCAASCFRNSSGTREMLLFINICFRSYRTSLSSLPRNVIATPLLPARPVRPIRWV